MSKEIITKTKKVVKRRPLNETLFGLLFDAFRAVGANPDPKYTDQLQGVASKMASVIQAEAKLSAIAHMKRLQEAVMKAFALQDARIEALGKLVKELEKNADNSSKIPKISKEISDNYIGDKFDGQTNQEEAGSSKRSSDRRI